MRIKTLNFKFFYDRAFLCRLLLIVGWVLGILCGCIFAAQISDKVSLMHMLLQSHMSIVGGLAVSFLPLCISVALIYLNRTVFLIPIAFAKAFLYSYASLCVISAFGAAGWLVWILFLSSDFLISLLSFRLWFRYLGVRKGMEREILKTAICCVGVFIIDCLIVAPFTAMIL